MSQDLDAACLGVLVDPGHYWRVLRLSDARARSTVSVPIDLGKMEGTTRKPEGEPEEDP